MTPMNDNPRNWRNWHILEMHAYDTEGYLVDHYECELINDPSWLADWLPILTRELLKRAEDKAANFELRLDGSRIVWLVRPPGNQAPEQPVELPLQA